LLAEIKHSAIILFVYVQELQFTHEKHENRKGAEQERGQIFPGCPRMQNSKNQMFFLFLLLGE